MCHVYIILYPCGHPVIVDCNPCAKGMHPQVCHPANVHKTVLTYHTAKSTGLQLPPKCPATKYRQPCIAVPEDPIDFAHFCINHRLGIVDVAALAPAWVFDISGDKVGSKPSPRSVTDYVVTFYIVKNPVAMSNRLSMPKSKWARSWMPGRSQVLESGDVEFNSDSASKDVSIPAFGAGLAGGVALPQLEDGNGSEVTVKQEA